MTEDRTFKTFNASAFLANFAGMEDLAVASIAAFQKGLPELFHDVDEAIRLRNADLLRRSSHTFKGVVSNFRSESCRSLLESIERDATSSPDWVEIEQRMDRLRGDIRELSSELGQLVERLTKGV